MLYRTHIIQGYTILITGVMVTGVMVMGDMVMGDMVIVDTGVGVIKRYTYNI
jgi:hypothetical protein